MAESKYTIDPLRPSSLDGIRAEYPEMAAKAAKGDQEAISWIIGADELLSGAERARRPAPRHYGNPPRPTLDDFDKPGVIWGNA